MNLLDPLTATVDADGRLVLPTEVVSRLGLRPGTSVILDQEPDSIRLRRPVEQLAKVYVEPTSRCNLTCRTCIRNAWEEPLGDMSEETFSRLLEGLKAFDPLPAVFFGGFGEPLAHSRILEMVAQVKAAGVPKVELITNGCLLSQEMSCRLIEAGLDTLWVSLDGIRPESYSDVRLGALLPQVLENLRGFKEVRRKIQLASLSPAEQKRFEAGLPGWHDSWRLPEPAPVLGIVFVAMKRNVADLPGILDEGHKLGARQFVITNVLPYTPDLVPEILYEDLLLVTPLPTLWHHEIKLPPMDVTDLTRRPLWRAVHGRYETTLARRDVSGVTRRCPFVEAGSMAVTWNGDVSPCLPLMHTHDEFHRGRKRQVTRDVMGTVTECSLGDIWTDALYVAFRRRVQEFDFAPCIACGGCPTRGFNEEGARTSPPAAAPACGATD